MAYIDVMRFIREKMSPQMVTRDAALAGRENPILSPMPIHDVLGRPLDEVPENCEVAYFAMGCYWGAEKRLWQCPGVVNTAVGFMGGFTPHPTYRETCTGQTGHTETVQVVFDPTMISYEELLKLFWESHNPTEGFRQGNDIGTQYRSAIFTTSDAQLAAAQASLRRYQQALTEAKLGDITTEIAPAGEFYYAEADHQQYLHKNPDGYDCSNRTGVACPL